MTLAWVIGSGYLIGSIPFAFLVVRRFARLDLRRQGSGNIGAANVLRTTRTRLAVVTIALDVAKGVAAVALWQVQGMATTGLMVAGGAAVVGHIYPVWLGFRGGKGVATACGVFGVLAPEATLVAALAFVMLVWWSRIVSLGSVIAVSMVAPLAYLTRRDESVVLGALLTAALVLYRHRSNLSRVLAGTERRLGQRA